AGLFIYNTSKNKIEYYNGTAWKENDDIPTFTPGSVIFADSNGDLTEDNANFHYHDTNKRFIVGDDASTINIAGGNVGTTIASYTEDGTPINLHGAKFHDGTAPASVALTKSRGTIASPTIVQDGDGTGNITFYGYDGNTFQEAAAIQSFVDDTPGAADMPGSLFFATTPLGNAVAERRMKINQVGRVIIASTSTLDSQLSIDGAVEDNRFKIDTQVQNENLFTLGQHTNDNVGVISVFAKSRGTTGTPLVITSGDDLSHMRMLGYDGSTYVTGAEVKFSSTGSIASNQVPTNMTISTMDNSGTLQARLRMTANGRIGLNTTSPDTSAILDLTSTTKGFLPPRMTTTERNNISTPAAALTVYNTSKNKMEYYDGTIWKEFDDIPTFTQGSVIFADSVGDLTEDNTNFFWDNTN
ncbi:MAG: hypothetical protein GWN62_31345, partial [Aliifodinibius sp.]|nr:hypothetical protein [Fodinibius sp.]